MNKLTSDTYIEALKLANHYHGVQRYGGDPYIKHLLSVTKVLKDFGYRPEIYPELHISAILHDILEDTPCSYTELKLKFGEQVADIVYDVTDELGKSNREKFERGLKKIKDNYNAMILKIADKVAFARECKDVNFWKDEYKFFKDKLYTESLDGKIQMMWAELETKFGG